MFEFDSVHIIYMVLSVTVQLFTEFMLIVKCATCIEHVDKLKTLHHVLLEIMPSKPQVY